MWIVFKLVIALIGFLIRWSRISFRRPHGTIDGSPYFLSVEKTKSGAVTKTKLAVPFSFPALFSFHFEDGQDAFWKKFGLSHEFQTGDQAFDRKIYIASDNSGLHQILEDASEVRTLIVEILGVEGVARGPRLRFDGAKLWVEIRGQVADVEGAVRRLIRLKTLLLSARDSVTAFWKDRFFLRCLLVESTIWSVAAYSWGSFIDVMFHPEDQHLRWARLILFTGITAAALIALLLFAVVTLIRGSSRAHRVIVESQVLLMFSVPVAAFSGFSDVNRSLDGGPGIVEQLDVQKIEKRQHRRRRGGVYYTYHVYLLPQHGSSSTAVGEGAWIEITIDRYRAAVSAQRAVMEIGPGRLGVPWIRELSFE